MIPILKKWNTISDFEKTKLYNSLKPLQKRILDGYRKLYVEYYHNKYETEARKAGDNAAGRIGQYGFFKRPVNDRITQRSMGTRYGDSPSEHQRKIPKDDEGIKGKRESFEEYEELDLDFNPNKSKSARNVNIDDIDEILPKIKPKDNIIERTIRPISSRLEEISPTLKHALRRFEFDSMGAENKSASIIKPFIDKVSKMNKKDWAKYDLALKNGYKGVVDTIADKKLTKCQVFLRGKNPARVRMSIFILGFIF